MEIKPGTSVDTVGSCNVQRDLEFSTSTCQTITDFAAYVHIDSEGLIPYENSTSAVLHYCTAKILKPYFRLLAVLGWRPLIAQWHPALRCHRVVHLINWSYTAMVLAFVLSGYFLQYSVCYRHDGLPPQLMAGTPKPDLSDPHNLQPFLLKYHRNDTNSSANGIYSSSNSINNSPSGEVNNRESFKNHTENHVRRGKRVKLSGISNKTAKLTVTGPCPGNVVTLYILPDLFHLAAYIYVLYLMRNPESERLATLMERSFLQTTKTTSWFIEQKKLIKSLWILLWFCLGWTVLSVLMHMCYFFINPIVNILIAPRSETTCWLINGLTVATLSWNDIICAAIVTNYAVHCQLNISYILNLCRTLVEKRLDFEEFYKRADETRKFVSYLNNDQALGVSLLLINFVSRLTVASYTLLRNPYAKTWELKLEFIILAYALLWLALLAMCLIQALRLTSACTSLREMGHVLRSRPFGYQDAEDNKLDSLILFTNSLQMEAKLLFMPIRSSSVALFVFSSLIVLLLIGQLN